jgi:hypothetical protein
VQGLNVMRITFVSLALLITLTAHAAGRDCTVTDIHLFAKEFALSFKDGSLSHLDKKYCIDGRLQVVIEHSVLDQTEKTTVQTFAESDVWLNGKKDADGYPIAAVWPLIGCHSNFCAFGGNNANQLHHHLFLKQIQYSRRKNGASITNIYFEDGD